MNKIALLLTLFLASCVYDADIDVDLFDPRLPAYSETGVNTAGAYMNGSAWFSRPETSFPVHPPYPFTINYDATAEKVSFGLSGNKYSGNQHYPVSLTFHIQVTNYSSIEDLVQWHGKHFTLDGVDNYAGSGFIGGNLECKGIGDLYIRNAMLNQDNQIVLSGTFAFTISDDTNCNKQLIAAGRFDVRPK